MPLSAHGIPRTIQEISALTVELSKKLSHFNTLIHPGEFSGEPPLGKLIGDRIADAQAALDFLIQHKSIQLALSPDQIERRRKLTFRELIAKDCDPNHEVFGVGTNEYHNGTLFQYFYYNIMCPADSMHSPDCICWRNFGEGPYPHVRIGHLEIPILIGKDTDTEAPHHTTSNPIPKKSLFLVREKPTAQTKED